MFSRFTNALYSAVDALAPPHPLQEDFIWHWKSITRFYTGKNVSNSVPIDDTSIPGHLREMLSILEQEENEIEIGNIGPCMEYVMQHKLLDTMCVLATSDSPPGMKRHMFLFVNQMLTIIQETLIPHVSICVPVQNFVKLCGEVLASPTEREEMDLLQRICDKIQENPDLINCFCLVNCESTPRRESVVSPSKEKSIGKEYALISSLLKMYKSPDNEISRNAKTCLMSLCSNANDTAAITIAQFSDFSKVLCSSIITLYKEIPKTIKLEDLENPIIDEQTVKISKEKRKYLCYLQQLNFIDYLVDRAHHAICDNLCYHFKTGFLDTYLYKQFSECEDLDELLYLTTLISTSIRYIKSSKLVDTFARFLLDDDIQDFTMHSGPTIKSVLIRRCYGDNAALSMCSLQLFEELLMRPTKYILDSLVLKYIGNRGYYDHSASDSWLQFADDDACSRYSDDMSSHSASALSTKSMAPTYTNRIVDAFIALLPNDIKSCANEEEMGYDTYIKESSVKFLKILNQCEGFEWPQNLEKEDLHPEDDSSSESQPEADSAFYEGAFLKMLFDKLELMLNQPYEINLQLTAIISRLALFANPYIHEYFLNPLIPCQPGVRSLFGVLLKVSEEIQEIVPKIKGYSTKLKLTRNALLSDGNEYATFEETNVLEALIVLEEFSKELAAITFVKYHSVS